MTPGNLELVEIVVSWTTTLPAVAVVIVRDERRLTGERLARAWEPPSRDAAIFGTWNLGLHPLCVLVDSRAYPAKRYRGGAGSALAVRSRPPR